MGFWSEPSLLKGADVMRTAILDSVSDLIESLALLTPRKRVPKTTEESMTLYNKPTSSKAMVVRAASLAFILAVPSLAFAQSPWENAVSVLETAFTGPIARGLSLVAIVVGGLIFAYGEGAGKKTMAGIVFGVGMAIGAVNFMAWLFP